MPPQSRGVEATNADRGISLNSYSDTPHRPDAALTPGQTTPTAVEDDTDLLRTPTPATTRFGRRRSKEAEHEQDDDEEEEEEDDDDDTDSLDDAEFESHYSRQESSASSDDDEDEDDEDQSDEEDDHMSISTSHSNLNGTQIHRISSLPTAMPPPLSSNYLHYSHHLNSSHSHLHTSRSTTSLPRSLNSYNPSSAPPLPPPLYPPFYNRPPTPLPPSPSLTSLLRPPSLLNRSTTSTRPTTPDSSDLETPNDTESAVARSARRADPLPPTAPKVPTYEYYGFVLYLASTLAFFLYILWSYLPSPFLHTMGIRYYPNRWWALAIPGWIVMLLVYIYVALACWNTEYLTLGLSRLETMVDEAGNVAILDDQGRVIRGGSKRFERDIDEEIRKRDFKSSLGNHSGSWAKRKGGTGGRKKERRRKEKEREREREELMRERERLGYMGPVFEGGKVACGLSWRQIWNEGTDAVMDVPIGGVCEVLYGEGRDVL